MLETWFGDGGPPDADVLSAMVAVVDRSRHGEGLSRVLLEAMVDLARAAGFSSLIAPVRPTWKERYPLIPMESYAWWTRDDGLPVRPLASRPLPPWRRAGRGLPGVDADRGFARRVGGVDGDGVPANGEYVLAGGLVPVVFRGGRGICIEPNVWMRHSV